jgi:arginase family enzyme
VVDWNKAVHEAMYQSLAAGRLPILLGGDHCLGIGSISAVARHCRDTGKTLRVLWLDAHTDFNTNDLTPTGNVHGMPVAVLCGHGPAELTSIGGNAGHEPVGDTADRHPQRGRRRKALCAARGPGGVRHALHRRDGDAPHHGKSAGRAWTPTPICT